MNALDIWYLEKSAFTSSQHMVSFWTTDREHGQQSICASDMLWKMDGRLDGRSGPLSQLVHRSKFGPATWIGRSGWTWKKSLPTLVGAAAVAGSLDDDHQLHHDAPMAAGELNAAG